MPDPLPYYKGKNLLGIATDFMANTPEFIERMEPELGDFFRVKVPVRNMYVTTRPEIIRFVLQTHPKLFKKSKVYQEMKLFLGEGLVTSEGDLWRRQRRLAQPIFYKKYLSTLFGSMEEESIRYVQALKEKIEDGKSVDMSLEMMQVTSDIVMKALFSTADKNDKESTYDVITFFQQVALQRLYKPWTRLLHWFDGTWNRYQKAKAAFDKWMYDLIRERKAMTDRPADLLSMLLEARYEDTDEGMSEEQLRDELITMYVAGHETSANALAWTLFLLAQAPKEMDRMRKEFEQVAGERGRLEFEQLKELTYTRQVLEEGMRLYPPAYVVSRVLKEETEIEGHSIPEGATLYLSIYGLHRSPKYWKDPKAFNPDRFSPEASAKRPKGIYLPFGAGARMCIGNHFALMEMQILLAYLISRFDFRLEGKQQVETHPLVTLKPREGIRMQVQVLERVTH